MKDLRPGLNFRRLVRLMQTAIEHCGLDLSDLNVLTEAATGAYIVTPVMAAMAGAKRVFALTGATRYGTVEEVLSQNFELAALAGVQDRIELITKKSREVISQADIITNSGHVRPIDAKMIAWMKSTAVISLMYEAWEWRLEDVDLGACRERGIAVAGINECHPEVDVFSFLGVMAIKLLLDSGVAVYRSHILVLCDNPFGPFIVQGLERAGAIVQTASGLSDVEKMGHTDAILVALRPKPYPLIGHGEAAIIAEYYPGVVVVQFWGDLDRVSLADAGVTFWTLESPESGHMGILPSALGPEPIARLQAGGLKVGQVMARCALEAGVNREKVIVEAAVASGFGQVVLEQ